MPLHIGQLHEVGEVLGEAFALLRVRLRLCFFQQLLNGAAEVTVLDGLCGIWQRFGLLLQLSEVGHLVGAVHVQLKAGHLVEVVPQHLAVVFLILELGVEDGHGIYDGLRILEPQGAVFHLHQLVGHALDNAAIFWHGQALARGVVLHKRETGTGMSFQKWHHEKTLECGAAAASGFKNR